VYAEWKSRGITDEKIRIESRKEQIGSARVHPKSWIRTDEMITATLPSVSAST